MAVPLRRPPAQRARRWPPAATGRSAAPTRSTGIHVAVNRVAPGRRIAEPLCAAQPHHARRGRSPRTPPGSAYVNHLDDDTGRLEVGYLADLVVLDRDPFACPTDEIADARGRRDLRRGRARLLRHLTRTPTPSLDPALEVPADVHPPDSPPLSARLCRGRRGRCCWPPAAAPPTDSDGDPGDASSGAATRSRPRRPSPSGDIDSFTWSIYAEPLSLDYAYAFDYPPNQVLVERVREPAALERRPVDLARSRRRRSTTRPDDLGLHDPRRRDLPRRHHPHRGRRRRLAATCTSTPQVGSYWACVYRNVKSIEKTGDMEVTVTLTAAGLDVQPVHGGLARAPSSRPPSWRRPAPTTATRAPASNCTGPFSSTRWTSGQSITLKRYDDYWDADLEGQVRRGQVRLPDRTRTPGSTPGRTARSTAAGWSRRTPTRS